MILKLADDLFESLYDGTKFVTIRKGQRDISLGINTMESISGDDQVKINVYQVTRMLLGLVPDTVAQDDGFEDAEEMLEGMKKHYPDIDEKSEVTIIYFEV